VDYAVDYAKFDENSRKAGYSYRYGSLYPGYPAWADYFNEVLSISIDRNYLDLCENSGFYWLLDDICFASERPSQIKLDDRGQLHSETGMSISYPSGWGLFHWHGVAVPKEWILDKKSITPDVALKWGNTEQRRCACEIVGWANILPMVNAKLIDKDPNPQYGELYEVKHEAFGNQEELFLKVQCGTGRTFCIPVTNFKQKTAREANAATYGWKPGLPINEYLPAIRT
jgi:hypothetical protein